MAERATEWLHVVSALCGEITGLTAWACFTHLFLQHRAAPREAGARRRPASGTEPRLHDES